MSVKCDTNEAWVIVNDNTGEVELCDIVEVNFRVGFVRLKVKKNGVDIICMLGGLGQSWMAN